MQDKILEFRFYSMNLTIYTLLILIKNFKNKKEEHHFNKHIIFFEKIMTMHASRNPAYDYLIKLIIIGDSGVGKTCLLLRFA